MTSPRSSAELLESQFHDVRARILDIAASIDRIERGSGSVADDDRLAQLREAISELLSDESGRAERIQQIFSLPYDPAWKQTLGVPR